jgi:thiamine-phosphate pyrophosphorylase
LSKGSVDNFLYRILDANINRTQEGLRVCEEIARFILNNSSFTLQFKKLRHRLNSIIASLRIERKELIKYRDTKKDVGKKSIIQEMKRKDFKDILFVNLQRIKESLRVLEEFSKLIDKKMAERFKRMRYEVYNLEKKIALFC